MIDYIARLEARGKNMTDYITRLEAKGWTVEQLAKRWKVEPSEIGEEPTRKDMDALRGLPTMLKIHKSQAGHKSVIDKRTQL